MVLTLTFQAEQKILNHLNNSFAQAVLKSTHDSPMIFSDDIWLCCHQVVVLTIMLAFLMSLSRMDEEEGLMDLNQLVALLSRQQLAQLINRNTFSRYFKV
ncbi:MAG: hypothetical protein OXC40_06865 [Proteobacteria bacterium]|nr:hypothetical protein [Pseudomonadota bacterium]